MAESREWTHWHLTPRGWERGAWKLDGPSDTSIPPPSDRVLSYEYKEEMTSPFSGLAVYHHEIWRGDDEKQIEQLLARYGSAPKQLFIP